MKQQRSKRNPSNAAVAVTMKRDRKGAVHCHVSVKRDGNGLIRCRVCGCTEAEPCAPSCSWVEADLCSGCAEAADLLYEWFVGAHRPSRAALLRELDRLLVASVLPWELCKARRRREAGIA